MTFTVGFEYLVNVGFDWGSESGAVQRETSMAE